VEVNGVLVHERPGREQVHLADDPRCVARRVDDHDVLLGGFPCQPFSIAGVSISQLWWTTQLAGVALAFAVAMRAQARETARAPRAFNQRPVLKI
jgi:site-specific DNA-cytosine methylase